MKKNRTTSIAVVALLVVLALPFELAARQHHHYKLIDMGTFGGPQSYVDRTWTGSGPTQSLNHSGIFTGWADTAMLDPFPDFCFDPPETGPPCFAGQAFERRNGLRIPLGVLPGGASSASIWVSANGLIAGASQNGKIDPLVPGAPIAHAVMWKNAHIIDLGTLPEGGFQSGAHAVNSRGQVVGWALNTVPDDNSMAELSIWFDNWEPVAPFEVRAFLWENGVMKDLGTLGTGHDAFGFAINEAGQVIGIAYTNATLNQTQTTCALGLPGATTTPTQDPFLWQDGKMIDLGGLGGTCGWPNWINNHGQVVGASDMAGDQVTHAFLWTKANGMQDLQEGSLLDGSFGHAEMVNESGDVVGGANLTATNETHAFLWNGKMNDLGNLNGCAYAFSLNARDQVVGNWGTHGCGQGAFLWEDGGPMVDLNTLVSFNSGLSVTAAFAINDRGEIGGIGVDANGNMRAILLIPCDENHPSVEGCDFSMIDTSPNVSAASSEAATQAPVTGNTAANRTRHRLRGRLMP
jgi:probable HAF family extracellular repeat protein